MHYHYKLFIVLIITVMCIGFSDRGLMPFDPDIEIFEPNQRAIIAWNGNEQILLLSTDIFASESTMVLEVLPLPSEPRVKKGAYETFLKVTNIINTKILNAYAKRSGEAAEHLRTPGGVVTWHEQIGAHDISVIQLVESETFMTWVKDYLDSVGVEREIVSDTMAALIQEYISDGFIWFVFDVITLGDVTVSNEPIQYWFASDSLFYPLRITSTSKGRTSIQLIILTPQLLSNFPALPMERIELKHMPVTITNAELREIDEDMYKLLQGHSNMKLRIWNIEGELKSFDQDLIAH